MKRTSLELAVKNTDDAEMISLYKKQIAQLAACIAEREGRIERRTKVINTISEREQAEFRMKLYRAKDDADDTFQIGSKYRSGPFKFEVKDLKNGIIGVVSEDGERVVVSGRDVKTLAEVFFFDYPAAVMI